MSVSPPAGVAVTVAVWPTGTVAVNGKRGSSAEVSNGWPGTELSTPKWHHGDGSPRSCPSQPRPRHCRLCPAGTDAAGTFISYVCGADGSDGKPGVSGNATTGPPAVRSCHSNFATTVSPPPAGLTSGSVTTARRTT